MMIYCSKCSRNITWTQKNVKLDNGKIVKKEGLCGFSKKNFSICKFSEKHKYKISVHIPGTTKGTTTKILEASTYNNAVSEAILFQNEIKQAVSTAPFQEEIPKSERVLLLQAQVDYIDFRQNIDVPEHLKTEVSDDHVKEIVYCFKLFNKALEQYKINKKLIQLRAINDLVVGYFHSYLLNTMKYSGSTYDNKMGVLKTFFDWALENFKLNIKNPFGKVKSRKTFKSRDTITHTEFLALLEKISPENGKMFYQGKRRENKNRYKPFLKDAIKLGLYTGGRREEIIAMKWNMIKLIDGEPAYIEVPNFKVERIKRSKSIIKDTAPKIIPINDDLLDELYVMGYKNKMGTEDYILDRKDSKATDRTLMDQISKGFSHFYGLLNTGKQIQFKALYRSKNNFQSATTV